MKKLIFIMVALIGLAFTVNAQMLTTQLQRGQTYADVTTDYTLTDATAKYWQINAQLDYMTAQDVIVTLDSATGNHTNVAVSVYGRKSDQTTTWTQIGSTINFKGGVWANAGHDTTIIFSNTTEYGYRQFKILFTGSGTGTTTIQRMEFKAWYGTP